MAYPNNWVDDGKVWVYYDISDISSATTILNQTTNIGSTINVDGTDVALASSYQFSATGEHLIKYTLSGSTWGQQLRNIKTITKVFFPSTVTVVGSQAFQGSTIVECHGEGITTVGGIAAGWGGGAFTQVTSLVVLDFPNLTTIQRGGCYQCANLETFNGLENISSLEGSGINGCTKLGGDITFHNLTSLPNPGINDLAFTRVYLPKIVSSNGGSGTGNCGIGALHSAVFVEFGSDITSIGNTNLGSCENLMRVHILATTPPSLGSNFLYGSPNALIYVPAESLQSYKEASGWSNYASRIFPLGDEKRLNINHMSLGDFRRRIMIGTSKKAWLPNDGKIYAYFTAATDGSYQIANGNGSATGAWSKVEIDGVDAGTSRQQTLQAGEHLLIFTLPNNTQLGDIFLGRYGYTKIYLPTTITTIKDNAFNGTSRNSVGATKVYMDKTKIVSIGFHAFLYSGAVIGDVNFPNLSSLGQAFESSSAFAGKKVKNLGSITTIPQNGLRCDFISFDLPATVTSLGSYACAGNNYGAEFIVRAVTPPTYGTNAIYRTPAFIKVPAESVEAYKTASGWSSWANKIQAISE